MNRIFFAFLFLKYVSYLGFAYVGGACVVNKRLEKVNSVAIIEDTGGFSGIIVAAHEVGHLYAIFFFKKFYIFASYSRFY